MQEFWSNKHQHRQGDGDQDRDDNLVKNGTGSPLSARTNRQSTRSRTSGRKRQRSTRYDSPDSLRSSPNIGPWRDTRPATSLDQNSQDLSRDAPREQSVQAHRASSSLSVSGQKPSHKLDGLTQAISQFDLLVHAIQDAPEPREFLSTRMVEQSSDMISQLLGSVGDVFSMHGLNVPDVSIVDWSSLVSMLKVLVGLLREIQNETVIEDLTLTLPLNECAERAEKLGTLIKRSTSLRRMLQ